MNFKIIITAIFAVTIGMQAIAGNNPHHNDDALIKTFIQNRHRVQDKLLQESLANSNAWQSFLIQNPGWWVSFNEENRKPHRATGKAINTGVFGTPQKVAWSFMQNELKGFGLPMNEIILRNVAENQKFNYVHFKQYYQGLEVLWANAVIKMNKKNEVILFGLDVYDDIKISITPTLTATQAISAASKGVINVTNTSTPLLKVLPVPTVAKQNKYHLVYELIVSNSDEENIPAEYYTLVDANTGIILYRQNNVMHIANTDVNTTATVYPVHPYLPTSVINLTHVRVTVGGNTYYTDSVGYLGLSNATAVNATISLNGKWSNTKTNNVTPSFNTTLNPGSNAILYDPHATINELTGFKNVNEMHDYFKLKTTGLSINSVMDFVMGTNIDVSGSCNAFYNGEVNFYPQAGGCNATSLINDVVYHEYGHGINSDLYQFYGGNFGNGAMGEGYADTWANGLTEDPVLGIGFYDNNAAGYVRRYDIGKKVYPQDLIGEVHADGEIIAGCWWDVALNFGSIQDRQDLFILTQAATITGASGTEGQLFADVLIEALTSDDNDGNLANGTPRYCQITNAFAIHGITIGGATATVALTHTEPAVQTAFTPINLDAIIPTAALPSTAVVTAFYKTTLSQATPWSSALMTNTGGNNWSATLPGYSNNTIVYYYFDIVNTDSCGTLPLLVKPFLANDTNPNIPYNLLVGYNQLDIQDFDNFQGPWTMGLPSDNATTGIWTVDLPIASLLTPGNPASYVQPGFQNTPGGFGCALTGNANINDGAGTQDVDNGKTTLITPVYDLSTYTNPAFSYYRFYSNDQGATPGTDFWQVAISNDNGVVWVPIENTNISDHSFRRYSFKVSDYVIPTSQILIRFIAEDANDGSLIEGLVDDVVLWDAVPAGIAQNTNNMEVNIFPNPTKNLINVTWNNISSDDIAITILNTYGSEVYHSTNADRIGKNKMQIQTTNFQEGVYFVKVIQNGMQRISKITVIK